MSRPVRITPLAEADIERAQDDYEAREQGLGNRFVIQAASRWTASPQTPSNIRLFPARGTPAAHASTISRSASGIGVEPDESIVVACLAHRADPALAKRRALRGLEPT